MNDHEPRLTATHVWRSDQTIPDDVADDVQALFTDVLNGHVDVHTSERDGTIVQVKTETAHLPIPTAIHESIHRETGLDAEETEYVVIEHDQ